MGIDILFSKTVFSWWNNIISWIILREMYSRWKAEYHSDLWTRTLTIWIYKYMYLGINSYLYLTAAWEWKKQFKIYENKFKYLYMLLGFLLEFALSLGVARKELRTRGTLFTLTPVRKAIVRRFYEWKRRMIAFSLFSWVHSLNQQYFCRFTSWLTGKRIWISRRIN